MSTTELHLPMTGVRTLTDALTLHARERPDQVAYIFLRDGEQPEETLTYGELDTAARARAAALCAAGLAGGNAVLLYPTALEFVRTLAGCLYAGVTGAPVQVPTRVRGLQRLRRIADDAGASVVLTTGAVKRELEERFGDRPELAGLTLTDTESIPSDAGRGWSGPAVRPDDLALLQYTSGSTGDPKGVMVTHANFLHNAAETDELWPAGSDGAVVSWLPIFHDMGLLFGVVFPLWAGIPAYLMAPEAFVRRPARWLEAISRFRGTHAAAPSFAYELCVRAAAEGRAGTQLDLSSWRVAVNGAEPVRPHVVRAFTETFASVGFAPRAMCPGYGLAENTLKATGSRQDRAPAVLWVSAPSLAQGTVEVSAEGAEAAVPVVGSGVAVPGTTVRIVDPLTLAACPPERVGEIWIAGPCVAKGYRGRAQESELTFRARVRGGPQEGEGHLRTGDLGFLHDGELYVTGRLKDVVIRKGRNYYPQDIELSAESAAPGLRPNCAAAFGVDDGAAERLVVVLEADGRVLKAVGAQELRRRVRDAVMDGQRLEVDDVVLVRPGAVPKTSSGKVQRGVCRTLLRDGALADVTRTGRPS
ncbi:fatty acyl-AMP ligase [Streptomyces sp. SID3343]|uniref:fatty acyl-AMP ligase n=1 Tax=Streptomyces sp. SID3343 TaxID=2690260 RepID=UPI0013689D3C|nr:fatty acyl-AMP ligase [Streptomyces sp. SID3343]MYW01631.1 AMP-binding protein [Streptomyces sp. SID3343]